MATSIRRMTCHVERPRLRPVIAMALVWLAVATLAGSCAYAAAHMFDRDESVRERALKHEPDDRPLFDAVYCTGGAVLVHDEHGSWCQRTRWILR